MRDQLTLGLEPPLPAPGAPGVLAPMLPVLRRDPFSSPDFVFTPSFGGRRVLVRAGSEVATAVFDASGAPVAEPITLAGPVVEAARSAVLDAELIAVDRAGRPALLAFDLLYLDGSWLLAQPLERRLALLDRVLAAADGVMAVPWFAGEGQALHAAAVAQGLAGVLARRVSSPYLPGVRSRLWRFVPADPSAEGPPEASAELPAEDGEPPAPASPMLALLRRLPLDFGE